MKKKIPTMVFWVIIGGTLIALAMLADTPRRRAAKATVQHLDQIEHLIRDIHGLYHHRLLWGTDPTLTPPITGKKAEVTLIPPESPDSEDIRLYGLYTYKTHGHVDSVRVLFVITD